MNNIQLAHGSGGQAMQQLINSLFMEAFANPWLAEQEDQARLELAQLTAEGDRLAFSTDSYVIDPLFFPGGNIGKLAICGTANDVAVSGAIPRYLSCGFILEEGLPMETLKSVVNSMAATAREADIAIVTGDTKVVQRGAADKLFINTAGMGAIPADIRWGAQTLSVGDVLLVSGTLGDHGATILNLREQLGLDGELASDCAVLTPLIQTLRHIDGVKALRDATRGAFTGASAQRIGRFELADKSSLFLDEVGDMPLELQPKLLRVLQEQEFERLGSNKLIQTDVRLIAATNRDLKKMVADREFRNDLYYRLNVFPIQLPPLRERPEDIPLLVKAFTFKIARRMGRNIDSIPAETLRTLSSMEWPGNVRELENVVERAVLLTRGNVLQLSLPDITAVTPDTSPVATESAKEGEDEYQLIIRVLKETNGVVAGPKGAAQRLGLKRTTLLSRMKRLGIDKDALA
ncbi:hydrogenase expression/formation protein HypE [Salmonella enterica subsp. enterica serovar Typhimurium]|nr:hydrogenase expression/formation protein HypE [Salmonella enterica subsp. enterica serovar Typhimurium]